MTSKTQVVERAKAAVALMRTSALARSVKRDRLTFLSGSKLLRLERCLDESLVSTEDGDYLEFGVALGGSGILIAHAANRRLSARFIGFDVFGMIPEPTSHKDDSESKNRYKEIAQGAATGIRGDQYYGYRSDLRNEVEASFKRHGLIVDGERVLLVKGLFEDTWPSASVSKVAFCHIDCDWYDPMRYCLEHIAPLLVPRGQILLDDYHAWGGSRTAADEFLAANPAFVLEDGPSVIIRRREDCD